MHVHIDEEMPILVYKIVQHFLSLKLKCLIKHFTIQLSLFCKIYHLIFLCTLHHVYYFLCILHMLNV